MSDPALKLGPKGEVRWRAFSHDGRYSPSFKMWVLGEDVYFAQRSIKDMKVSLHTKTGDAHAAFNTHEASEAWTGKWAVPNGLRLEHYPPVHPRPA